LAAFALRRACQDFVETHSALDVSVDDFADRGDLSSIFYLLAMSVGLVVTPLTIPIGRLFSVLRDFQYQERFSFFNSIL